MDIDMYLDYEPPMPRTRQKMRTGNRRKKPIPKVLEPVDDPIVTEFFKKLDRGLCTYGYKDTLQSIDRVSDILCWENDPRLNELVSECDRVRAIVHIISDNTKDGHYFVHGFGGVGAILRYTVPDEH